MKNFTEMLIVLCLIQCANLMLNAVVTKQPICDEYNPSYLRNLTICMNNSQMNLDVDVVKQLSSGLRLNIEFFSRKYKSSTYQSFYQYSLDMCSLLNIRNNNMFKNWIAQFRKYGNVLRNCPFPAKHYYIRDYNGSGYDIPSFFFPGTYRISSKLFQRKKASKDEDFVLNCIIEVEVKLI